MDLTFHIEPFVEAWEQMKLLVPANCIAANMDRPVHIDHRKYAAAADRGRLLVVTARHGGRMVGYYMGIVSPDIHHTGELQAISDAYYMVPSARSLQNARALFAFVHTALEMMGVNTAYVTAPFGQRNILPLLTRMGYREREVILSRVLRQQEQAA